jgi:hypothetical protein
MDSDTEALMDGQENIMHKKSTSHENFHLQITVRVNLTKQKTGNQFVPVVAVDTSARCNHVSDVMRMGKENLRTSRKSEMEIMRYDTFKR